MRVRKQGADAAYGVGELKANLEVVRKVLKIEK